MSGHRRVKDISYEDDYDEYDEDTYEVEEGMLLGM